jgi:hypothetical protein
VNVGKYDSNGIDAMYPRELFWHVGKLNDKVREENSVKENAYRQAQKKQALARQRFRK